MKSTRKEGVYKKGGIDNEMIAKNHFCDICTRSFGSTSQLNHHKVIHSGKKLFRCDKCEKSFATKNYLKIHEKSHSRSKSFKSETCEICNKQFRSKYDFRNHVRIHTNEKPFECKECGKCFTSKDYLARHQSIH